MNRFAVTFAAPLAAAALIMGAAFSPLQAEEKLMERTVTVSASGSVSAVPDEATIQTGVSNEAKTARDAMSKNTGAMKKVITELQTQGVEPKDIQTTQFNIEPVYVYPKEGQPPVVTGYRVNNMVSVRVRDLDKLGGVLDQLVTAGANQMHGISFGVSKAETLKDEARKEAMGNALRRAKLLAAAGGAEVGDVVQISEEVGYAGPRPVVFAKRAAMAEAAPVERGEQELETRVTVTWKLK
ncbi:MAG: SIMPL domain-containing protein [Hyphomicrobium sp.]